MPFSVLIIHYLQGPCFSDKCRVSDGTWWSTFKYAKCASDKTPRLHTRVVNCPACKAWRMLVDANPDDTWARMREAE
jgi:hypothetical protein